MKLLIPFGTRPEIIKLSSVVHALRRRGFSLRVVATGQHYDPALSDVFCHRLDVQPDERWDIEGDEALRVAGILAGAYREVTTRRPDAVLLLGDTYTVPIFCLAARRFDIPIVHLEAGLRSFNHASVEEANRRIAGATASIHLAPTPLAAGFLRVEGIRPDRVHVVGNPIIDVAAASGVERVPVAGRSGVVVTAHRPANVDDPDRLCRLVEIVRSTGTDVAPVTFPVHPRTRQRLSSFGLLERLDHPAVTLLPPLPYEQMVRLIAGAQVVMTDSGGLQEEAAWFGVPAVVLRRSTPRWEGVAARTSALVGLDHDLAVAVAREFTSVEEQRRVAATPCPYGDGKTGRRVAALLSAPAIVDVLRRPNRAPAATPSGATV